MTASANRKVNRLYSKDNLRMYRVMKNYQGDAIIVVRHYSEEDASDLMREICAHDNGKVYEVKGMEVDSFPTSGAYRWSLKEATAFVAEQIEKRGHY